MKRKDTENETESESNQTKDGDGKTSESNRRSDRVAKLHRTEGNQAVHRLVKERVIQAKLEISSPSDPAEREAQKIVEKVTQMNDGETRGRSTESEKEGAQRDADVMPSESVNRSAGGGEVPEEVESTVRSGVQGGGKSLPAETRSNFESKMGADFSDVRVHTGSAADEAARSINAEAYTMGSDIAFRAGSYNPRSREGKKLLAHELTHTVQQNEGHTVQKKDGGGGEGGPAAPILKLMGLKVSKGLPLLHEKRPLDQTDESTLRQYMNTIGNGPQAWAVVHRVDEILGQYPRKWINAWLDVFYNQSDKWKKGMHKLMKTYRKAGVPENKLFEVVNRITNNETWFMQLNPGVKDILKGIGYDPKESGYIAPPQRDIGLARELLSINKKIVNNKNIMTYLRIDFMQERAQLVEDPKTGQFEISLPDDPADFASFKKHLLKKFGMTTVKTWIATSNPIAGVVVNTKKLADAYDRLWLRQVAEAEPGSELKREWRKGLKWKLFGYIAGRANKSYDEVKSMYNKGKVKYEFIRKKQGQIQRQLAGHYDSSGLPKAEAW